MKGEQLVGGGSFATMYSRLVAYMPMDKTAYSLSIFYTFYIFNIYLYC
jgi:hypothetical protein